MRVPAGFPVRGRPGRLVDYSAERAVLGRLLDAVRRSLAVHGEPGAGKTGAVGVPRGAVIRLPGGARGGCQPETELAFAGLRQLCTPMLDRLEALPTLPRGALRTEFGISAEPALDLFLVGLALLGLLSELAADWPLICLVDDARWLDRVSPQVTAFAARHLGAESVGLVFGARVLGEDLAELVAGGLPEADARAEALLDPPRQRQCAGQLEPPASSAAVFPAGSSKSASVLPPVSATIWSRTPAHLSARSAPAPCTRH